MNIGSIELQLFKVTATSATYRSENLGTEFITLRVNVQQGRTIPKRIELKLWVDSDEFIDATTIKGTV